MIARLLIDRGALPGDQAFIDLAFPIQDHSIRADLVAVFELSDIAQENILHLHIHDLPVAQHMRFRRRKQR